MTKHMFRVYIGRGKMSVDDLEARIDDWAENNGEWDEGRGLHELTPRNTEEDGSGEEHHQTDIWFFEGDVKANILQKLGDKLKDKVDWYRVAYHPCPHDGTLRMVEETHDLEPGVEVGLDYGARPGTVTIGDGGYVEGEDYTLQFNMEDAGTGTTISKTLTILEDTSISAGTYTVEYGTTQCDWDDAVDWTAKDISIPSGVPTFEVTSA